MSEHDLSIDSHLPDHDVAVLGADDSAGEDPWAFDTDSDGVTDVVQWNFADGTWQELRDVDGDGNADVLLIDTNGDDSADIQIWDNGDGTYTAAQDTDGDGQYETEQSFTRDELDAAMPGVVDLLDIQFGAATDQPPTTDPGTDTPPVTDPATDVPVDSGAAPVEIDADSDGITDVVQWNFADGTWQELRDVDGDGNADVLLIDTNGDDSADIQIWDNGDGTYTALQDADGDGVFETEQSFTRDELDASIPGVADLLDSQFGAGPDTPPVADQPPADQPPADQPPADQPVADNPSADQPPVLVDATGNPLTDAEWIPLDSNADGVIDAEQWIFPDGTWQALIDVDGNHQPDVLIIDTNGDDTEDIQVWMNPDGTYTVLYDADHDGTFEVQNTFDRAELDARLPGATALLDTSYVGVDPADANQNPVPDHSDTPVIDDPGTDPVPDNDVSNEDHVAGDPQGESQYWFEQAENGYCVPSSVAMIVSAYTGEEILSEDQFVELANSMGLLDMDAAQPGMSMDGALTLLEAAGVPAEMVVGDMDTLYDALDEGRGVMLFIDADEVWYGGEGQPDNPNHAVVITGIDPVAGVAYLSDPGSPDGNMEVVPLSVLQDAWDDSGDSMVVCDQPAPEFDTADAAAGSQVQNATSALVQGPWAILPVVLPHASVTTVS